MEAIELYKEERQKELEQKASQVTKDKTVGLLFLALHIYKMFMLYVWTI